MPLRFQRIHTILKFKSRVSIPSSLSKYSLTMNDFSCAFVMYFVIELQDQHIFFWIIKLNYNYIYSEWSINNNSFNWYSILKYFTHLLIFFWMHIVVESLLKLETDEIIIKNIRTILTLFSNSNTEFHLYRIACSFILYPPILCGSCLQIVSWLLQRASFTGFLLGERS